jgi:hypothetical protein
MRARLDNSVSFVLTLAHWRSVRVVERPRSPPLEEHQGTRPSASMRVFDDSDRLVGYVRQVTGQLIVVSRLYGRRPIFFALEDVASVTGGKVRLRAIQHAASEPFDV